MSAVLLPDRRVADERPGALAQTPTPTAVAVGGKTLRGTCQRDGTGGVHLLAAMTHHTGTVVDKTSEIAWSGPLLNRVDLAGMVVTADALHTVRD